MSSLEFKWLHHAYEAFGWVLLRGEKTKCTAHLTSIDGKIWHVAIEGLWWRSRRVEEEFSSRDAAKDGAERAIARAFRDLADSLGQSLAAKAEVGLKFINGRNPGPIETIPVPAGDASASLLIAREKLEQAHACIEQAIERFAEHQQIPSIARQF